MVCRDSVYDFIRLYPVCYPDLLPRFITGGGGVAGLNAGLTLVLLILSSV